jgi:hypothetical protein
MAINRNDAFEFARYTRCNLECIESAKASGNHEAHQVTQLMLSLLGLIVFPWATNFKESVESRPLEDVRGGEYWRMQSGERGTLKQFGKHLRNAVAHRRVEFSSDSGDYDKVDITFRDKPSNKDAPINWITSINAAHLRIFCMDLIKLLGDTQG